MALALPLGARAARSRALSALLAIAAGVACGGVAALLGPLYAGVGVLGLVVGAAVASNVRLAFLAFLLVATLLPFGVLPFSIGGVKPTLIDATLTLLLCAWLVRLLVRRDTWRSATPADGPLLAFVGVSLAAFVLGTAYLVTPELIRQYLKLVNSTLFFFTVTQLVRTRRDLDQVLGALVGGGAVAAAVGAGLYHLPAETAARLLSGLRPLGYPTGDVLRYVEDAGVRTDVLRAIGTSVDPNVFGTLLLMTGVLAVGGVLATGGAARRLYAVAAVVIGYTLLITLSRGSWVGFAAAVALIVAVRRRRLALLVPPGVAIGVLLFGAQLSPLLEHFLNAVYARDQATGMRLGEYKDALNLIQQHPWLGIGFGAAPSSDLYLGVSSTYLLVAEEMGLLGLALLLLVLWRVVSTGWRGYRAAHEPASATILTCLATFLGLLLAALFDRHYLDLRFPHVAALFWLVAAMVVISARVGRADEDVVDQPPSGTTNSHGPLVTRV
ncbi:MAG TPA: O-antigen ligase family protein [Chloroflexota bacterium]